MRKNPSSQQQKRLLKKNAGVCCVCKQRGLGVNFHHIDEDHSNTVDENLAVLCVRDHDAHHRPHVYTGLNHLELGAEKIRDYKKSWEAFVAEARQPNSTVLAVITAYGDEFAIHSAKLVFQWQSGKIEFVRVYQPHDGTIKSWADRAIEEVVWLNRNIKIVFITEPDEVQFCSECSKPSSLSRRVDENWAKKLTAESWSLDSTCTIYINPYQPSLAINIFLKRESLYAGHLHLCGEYLHYANAKNGKRVRIMKTPSVRTQATKIVQEVVNEWEPGQILIGTGNPDKPHRISSFDLPRCWEQFSRKAALD